MRWDVYLYTIVIVYHFDRPVDPNVCRHLHQLHLNFAPDMQAACVCRGNLSGPETVSKNGAIPATCGNDSELNHRVIAY